MASSIALFVAACVAIPKVLSKATVMLYKASITSSTDDNEDWGPIIERKDKDGGYDN